MNRSHFCESTTHPPSSEGKGGEEEEGHLAEEGAGATDYSQALDWYQYGWKLKRRLIWAQCEEECSSKLATTKWVSP